MRLHPGWRAKPAPLGGKTGRGWNRALRNTRSIGGFSPHPMRPAWFYRDQAPPVGQKITRTDAVRGGKPDHPSAARPPRFPARPSPAAARPSHRPFPPQHRPSRSEPSVAPSSGPPAGGRHPACANPALRAAPAIRHCRRHSDRSAPPAPERERTPLRRPGSKPAIAS